MSFFKWAFLGFFPLYPTREWADGPSSNITPPPLESGAWMCVRRRHCGLWASWVGVPASDTCWAWSGFFFVGWVRYSEPPIFITWKPFSHIDRCRSLPFCRPALPIVSCSPLIASLLQFCWLPCFKKLLLSPYFLVPSFHLVRSVSILIILLVPPCNCATGLSDFSFCDGW